MSDSIQCDVSGEPIARTECLSRHADAQKKAIFREKTGRPAKYHQCYACPTGIETAEKEKQEKKTMAKDQRSNLPASPYTTGVCKVCGENRRIFSRSRICAGCTTRKPAPVAKPAEPKEPKLEKKIETPTATGAELNLVIPNDIMNALIRRAVQEFRTPEGQALWFLREELKHDQV